MDSTNPTWIEPPPKPPGMGCLGKGCLTLGILAALVFLLLTVGGYFYFSRGVIAQSPVTVPVNGPLPGGHNAGPQRTDQLQALPPAPPSPPPESTVPTPAPTA